MKIVFKLNREQAARAAALVSRVAAEIAASVEWVEEYNSSWHLVEAGNLHAIYLQQNNSNQHLALDKWNYLTYRGERCPFVCDGARCNLMEILSGDRTSTEYERFVPAEYETSDTRLMWWETLSDYMLTRATLPERAAHMLATADRHGLPCIPTLENMLGVKLSKNVRALYASYDSSLATLLAALVERSVKDNGALA